jgi:proteasome alpha subunit
MDITNFISPKQLIEMKKDIVQQALARANPILCIEYDCGVLLLAENPSVSLNKISEIYDKIVFAGTGVYNDYERLRKEGVRYADLKGFMYSREDVMAKSLASEYSSILGEIFSRQQVALEVEILVAEIGDAREETRMYRIPFTGGLIEEHLFSAIGDIFRDKESGDLKTNLLQRNLKESDLNGEQSIADTFRIGYRALVETKDEGEISPESLEVVILDRTLSSSRKFRRLVPSEIAELIGPEEEESDDK